MPEILSPLSLDEKRSLVSFDDAVAMFRFAEFHALQWRQVELDRCWKSILAAKTKTIDTHWFLREFLWCVYVSGFSAQTISKKYDALLQAHRIESFMGGFIKPNRMNLFDADQVVGDEPYDKVLKIFNNHRKATYVQECRYRIVDMGWDSFYEEFVKDRDPGKLRKLKGIGPALSCHLARNLGNIDTCKPDVHLCRVAKKYGFESVEKLCKGVSDEPVGKTDLILWLASVDHGTT